jgi:hypothetical protein
MKRPQPPDAKPGRYEHDIKKAYTAQQLAEIGAIALVWNQIDEFINFLLYIVLRMPLGLWMPTTKRINGMDGKIEILRKRATQSKILNDDARAVIKLSLDAVMEYKGYRDAIVHSVPFDVDKGIAQRIGSRADVSQILLTIDALTAFYERLTLLLKELQEIDLLFRLADEVGAKAVYRRENVDPLERRRTRDVPIQTVRAREHQKMRLSLPPLPEFPDEDQAPSEMGGTNRRPCSGERDQT